MTATTPDGPLLTVADALELVREQLLIATCGLQDQPGKRARHQRRGIDTALAIVDQLDNELRTIDDFREGNT